MSKKLYTEEDMLEAYEAGRLHGYYDPEEKEDYIEMRKHEGYANFNEWLKKFEVNR